MFELPTNYYNDGRKKHKFVTVLGINNSPITGVIIEEHRIHRVESVNKQFKKVKIKIKGNNFLIGRNITTLRSEVQDNLNK